MRLLSGAKVMHNGQWVGLNEWGRAAAALRVRPEAMQIQGGLCVLSTKTMVDAMKKPGILDCGVCGMPVEGWFKKSELSEGELGTSGKLLSAMELCGGNDDLCLACWASAEYLHHPAADRIPEEYWRFCCRFAGRHVPKPGLWHEMVSEAFRQIDELGYLESDEKLRLEWEKREATMEAKRIKLAERIEDAMRKVQMAERLQGMGTDTPAGGDGSCWKTLPLWDVKLGEVNPLTGRKGQPWERKGIAFRSTVQRAGEPDRHV